MFSSSKSITVNYDFNKRFVSNLVELLNKINSNINIANIDRRVNAKSVLGLLSLSIKQDEIIRIDVLSSESVEKAQDDLHKVLEILNNN